MIFKFKNTSIYYKTYGKGPAVVLLHGFLESSRMWDPLISHLKSEKRVVTLDLPGMGQSGVLAEKHTMELMAQVVEALLDHLHISTASFVGHSMGGYITLACAEMFPEKVENIVLLNSTTTADSEEKRKNRDRAINIMQRNPRAFISMAIANWAGEDSQEKYKEEIEQFKEQAYGFPVRGVIAALAGMRVRKDRTEVFAKFPRQKLMILGNVDPLIPLDENQKIAREADAQTTVLKGGHLSLLDNQDKVVAEIMRFIG